MDSDKQVPIYSYTLNTTSLTTITDEKYDNSRNDTRDGQGH